MITISRKNLIVAGSVALAVALIVFWAVSTTNNSQKTIIVTPTNIPYPKSTATPYRPTWADAGDFSPEKRENMAWTCDLSQSSETDYILNCRIYWIYFSSGGVDYIYDEGVVYHAVQETDSDLCSNGYKTWECSSTRTKKGGIASEQWLAGEAEKLAGQMTYSVELIWDSDWHEFSKK